jgi:hypothetical protein
VVVAVIDMPLLLWVDITGRWGVVE